MKIFHSNGLVLVPSPWREGLGEPRHHQQAHVLVVAQDKAAAEQMLAQRVGSGAAYHLARALRVASPKSLPKPEQALVDAKIVSLVVPGVFAWYEAIEGKPVSMVEYSGGFRVMGYFTIVKGQMAAKKGTPA
ncbi:MAG: hypothetical protein ACTHJ6_00105 [Oryzihumus sp.]